MTQILTLDVDMNCDERWYKLAIGDNSTDFCVELFEAFFPDIDPDTNYTKLYLSKEERKDSIELFFALNMRSNQPKIILEAYEAPPYELIYSGKQIKWELKNYLCHLNPLWASLFFTPKEMTWGALIYTKRFVSWG